ncbi:MAG: phosphatidate cytidylyltransferase [Armatimonadota bacterium]|nr:phosphatidate cytidylyltransferase [Armatimonadota bacterium]MDR7402763.1 phosphatidate cytidylyltransferase [Armatimonadota bacterium]MDR7437024.1 phosphatidate cytidylyltransferase [Armatimonadota bacterium]MDR7472905.1 phosphatidate cytidylyltransferase [Armatimonadota bacterium]MDR7508910.1 phosphatidate cytidylyltransferase [Armatimonadota bacterium]
MADVRRRLAGAQLGRRTATAVAGIPLVVAALWAGGGWWIALLAAVGILGWWELVRLRPPSAPQRSGRADGLTLPATAAAAAVAARASLPATEALLAVWAVTTVLAAWAYRGVGRPSAGPVAGSPFLPALMAPTYLGVPLGLLARWRAEAGAGEVLAFVVTIWTVDVAAYAVGLAAGRHRLAPRISPGKSWEGAAAGLAAGLAVGMGTASILGLSSGSGAVFGVVVSASAQAGDLLESALKRAAGVKDSGALLPGHGGVLDRFDGMLVAAPVGYLLAAAWGR